jgi:hypothetical protein
MPNTEQILEEHKKLAMLSNNLSDFQLENLKTYPFIVFDSIESAKIEYDVHLKDNRTSVVKYHIKSTKEVDTLNFVSERVSSLKQWVRKLLWNEIVVEVFYNDKELK